MAASPPTGVAYSLVLVGHLLSAAVSMVGTTVAGIEARRAKRLLRDLSSGARGPSEQRNWEALGRYYHHGFNPVRLAGWAVPAFGLALVAMSRGAYRLGNGWVTGGFALWIGATSILEWQVWPGERSLEPVFGSPWARGAGGPGADECHRVEPGHEKEREAHAPDPVAVAFGVSLACLAAFACYLVAAVLMIFKP